MNRPFRESMTHPAIVAAVLLLVLNDHVFKQLWPGWISGKLSDFAGLAFFPLLLAGLIEIVAPGMRGRRSLLAAAIAATAMVFTAVQLVPPAADAYRVSLGWLQWPFRLLADPSAEVALVRLTPDPSDLVALPAVLVSWLVHRSMAARGSQCESERDRRPAFDLRPSAGR